MARHIDTAVLRAFLTVAETGGMTSAAQILNLTQAAVSQQIKRLEELFGVQLFERAKRTVQLSPDGERLVPYAQRMLETNDQMWGAMTTPHFEGEVRIGVPHDIVKAFMPPVLKRFNWTWPKAKVIISASTTPRLLDALEAGDIDLTLTTEDRTGISGEMLMADSLVWVGAIDGKAHLADPLPISLGDKDCAFRASAIKALADAGRDWRPVSDEGGMLSIYAALEADLGVAPLLASTIPSDLAEVSSDSSLPSLPHFFVNMYLPAVEPSDIAVELANHIRDHFGARPAHAA